MLLAPVDRHFIGELWLAVRAGLRVALPVSCCTEACSWKQIAAAAWPQQHVLCVNTEGGVTMKSLHSGCAASAQRAHRDCAAANQQLCSDWAVTVQ